MTLDDIPDGGHLSPATKKRMEAGYLPHEREARARGAELDYVGAQAYAAALIAAHCLELAPDDPRAAARMLRTTTFYGAFELDPATGIQQGHRLCVVRWRGGRRELLLADAA